VTVAIVGAGAIGGLLGAYLSRAGQDVLLIARGPHLAAMRSRGLTVRGPHEELTAHPRCTHDIGAVAEADVVFVTLKAHSIPAVAPALGGALRDDAVVVGAMNGIPWWYFPDRHLEAVDPGGVIARSIPLRQVVGCVVYPAASIVEPGVILHEEGDRFSLGEPDGSKSERVQKIAAMLTSAGFKAPV
jgi:2-dehydropantoate 2-reductase